MGRFRIKKSDEIKAYLFTKEGNLITSVYDSGFSRLDVVYQTLLNKTCNPPKKTKFRVHNITTDECWSNL